MSSDHYAQHLIQKYRLAVAIGVIQSKPEAKSLDQHISSLRKKINDDKVEDFAICSDDFDMDFNDMTDLDDRLSQHSETILKDFSEAHVLGNDEFEHTNRQNIFADFIDLTEDDTGRNHQTQNNVDDIQSTFCETQADTYIAVESFADIDKTFCDNVTVQNRDETIANEKACDSVTKAYKTQTTIDKTTCKNKVMKPTIDTDHTYCSSIVKINQNETVNADNTLCESIANTNDRTPHAKDITNKNIKQYLDQTTAYDSQATELYTLHTLTEDYTHVSQSQTNNINIANRYIKGISKSDNQDACKIIDDSLPMHVINTEFGNNTKDVNLVEKIYGNLSKISNTKQKETDNFVQTISTITGVASGFEKSKDDLETNEFCYNFKDINLVKKITKKLNEDKVPKALIKETIEQNTQTATNINKSKNIKENSYNLEANATNTEFEYIFKDINLAKKVSSNLGRQDNFINIPMELDFDNCDLSQADLNRKDVCPNNNFSQETRVSYYTDENSEQTISNQFETNMRQTTTSIHEISKTNDESMTMQVFNFSQNDEDLVFNGSTNSKITIPKRTVEDVQDEFLTNENNENTYINRVKDVSKANDHNSEYTMQVFDLSQNENNKVTNLEITKANVQNTETMQVFDCHEDLQNPVDSNKLDKDVENESISSEEISELVPFKVMEELNRVKAFLNRRVERRISIESSLDSGYRSDSQGRSKSALQLSANWIGQSAYCLYEYITRCPMVATTQEIVEEISQALGQLIDKLHEEESYPAFLEELLEYVDTLIRNIFSDEDMLLEKDEKIQRLFLLNKSIHIQKYSIEKLTNILENIQTSLTAKEELHELTNIQEIENLSYIFHILEAIIKNSFKTKKNFGSQSQTQESEVYQRKTTISDIWRKKWNPNYKEESKLDCSLDKKCVFVKCSEVLNKIVVGCLDGYSLVAFAALQCFNLLQS